MDRDAIADIGIDEKGRLYVAPQTKTFPFIYREALEVNWDDKGHYLHAPPPPRAQLATPIWWFKQIISAARVQGCELCIEPHTKWHNITPQLKEDRHGEGWWQVST